MDLNVERLLEQYFAACMVVINDSAEVKRRWEELSRASSEAISTSPEVRVIWRKLQEVDVRRIEFTLNVPFEIDPPPKTGSTRNAAPKQLPSSGDVLGIVNGDSEIAHTDFHIRLNNTDIDEMRDAVARKTHLSDDSIEATTRLLASIRALAERIASSKQQHLAAKALRDDADFNSLGIKFPGKGFLERNERNWMLWVEHVIELALKQPEPQGTALLKKLEKLLAKHSSADTL